MNWTKTDSGYAANGYSLDRTPGKRWLVSFDGTPLADGKHFSKLADAKQVAEDDVVLQKKITTTIAAATDITANLTHEQAAAGLSEVMGVEQCPDFPITSTTSGTASAPTMETATPPDVDTVSSSSRGSDAAAGVIPGEPKFCRPVPRENLTDQFTRLQFYRDIGIVRRAFLRESA